MKNPPVLYSSGILFSARAGVVNVALRTIKQDAMVKLFFKGIPLLKIVGTAEKGFDFAVGDRMPMW